MDVDATPTARPAVSLLQWDDLTDGERTIILTAASALDGMTST